VSRRVGGGVERAAHDRAGGDASGEVLGGWFGAAVGVDVALGPLRRPVRVVLQWALTVTASDNVRGQLRGVLEAQGLEVIDQTEAFDPNRHEAAMSEPGDEDQDEPMVSEVLRTGYAFNGRVLRAAMVRVKG